MRRVSLGILGFGTMGKAIAQGITRSTMSQSFELQATTHFEESAKRLKSQFSFPIHTDNKKLVKNSHVVLLCIKPQQAKKILTNLQGSLNQDQILISICASVSIDQIRKWSKFRGTIIRAMPNTPCVVGEGMTALATQAPLKTEAQQLIEGIFQTVGKTIWVDEDLMDGVTGLSGSGPAYIYLVIEALSEAGVKVGLPREVSTLLATQTLLGAAKMVFERKDHPAALKDEVTTPGGCTIDGLMALEEGRLRSTLIQAVLAATQRSFQKRNEMSD